MFFFLSQVNLAGDIKAKVNRVKILFITETNRGEETDKWWRRQSNITFVRINKQIKHSVLVGR